ncbi:MAG: hypothetical protein AB7I48_04865 [Planctomycetaceae bacterium]
MKRAKWEAGQCVALPAFSGIRRLVVAEHCPIACPLYCPSRLEFAFWK